MAVKAASADETFEEILFQNDRVSLCLLVNRRARSLRVVDFRSGPNPAKRLFVVSLAQREGVERVYTLVERDEVGTWTKLGFEREGSIPGFYKRSDAHLLGLSVPGHERATATSDESGVHRTVASDFASDKVYQAGRKVAKQLSESSLPAVRVVASREGEALKAVHAATRAGRALTGFERFGRDVERRYFACTARGGFSLAASAEIQPCFSNAFLELLTAPRTEKETQLATSAVQGICDALFEQEIVTCFSLSPADDVSAAAVYLANGFRRTGRLSGHFLIDGDRVDAYLWTRKLAQPDGA